MYSIAKLCSLVNYYHNILFDIYNVLSYSLKLLIDPFHPPNYF